MIQFTRPQLTNLILEIIEDGYEVPKGSICNDTNLRTDLNFDSLCMADIAYQLSVRLDAVFNMDDLLNVTTISDIVDICEGKYNEWKCNRTEGLEETK